MKWLLYPKRDVNGDGSIVATGYPTEAEEYPICTIRSYSKYYRVEVLNIQRTIIDIPYNNVELRRINRRLKKKQKKGQLTSEQYSNIILLVVCNMVESYHIF